MEQEKQQIKPFFRVFNADLVGEKPIVMALLKVKGVNHSIANALCNVLGISKTKKAGLLTSDDAKKIENLLKTKGELPLWLLNRRNDVVSGKTAHLTGSDLAFAVDSDIKILKRLRTYRGMRHAIAQPVRGQRTRSHFRSGRAVGVQKAKTGKKGQ